MFNCILSLLYINTDQEARRLWERYVYLHGVSNINTAMEDGSRSRKGNVISTVLMHVWLFVMSCNVAVESPVLCWGKRQSECISSSFFLSQMPLFCQNHPGAHHTTFFSHTMPEHTVVQSLAAPRLLRKNTNIVNLKYIKVKTTLSVPVR